MAFGPNGERGGDQERHAGMRRFIPAAAGARLGEALQGLSRPLEVRMAGEVTTAMCAVRTDLKGDTWIELDDQREVYVNPQATLGEISQILQPFVDAGEVPPDTIMQLQALVDASRGTCIQIYPRFPQRFRDASLDYDQMIAAGRLASLSPS